MTPPQVVDLHVVFAEGFLFFFERVPEMIGAGDVGEHDVGGFDAADVQPAVVEDATDEALLDVVAGQLLDADFGDVDLEEAFLVEQALVGENNLGRPFLQHHPEQKPHADAEADVGGQYRPLAEITVQAVLRCAAQQRAKGEGQKRAEGIETVEARVGDEFLVRHQRFFHEAAERRFPARGRVGQGSGLCLVVLFPFFHEVADEFFHTSRFTPPPRIIEAMIKKQYLT